MTGPDTRAQAIAAGVKALRGITPETTDEAFVGALVDAIAPIVAAEHEAEAESYKGGALGTTLGTLADDLRRAERERDEARAEVERLRVEVQNVWRFAVNEVRIKRDLIARGKQTADVALADLGALFARIAERNPE